MIPPDRSRGKLKKDESVTENAHYWTSQLHLHQRSGHMHGHILGSYWGVFTLKTSDGFIIYEHPRTFFLALHRIGLGPSERDKNELYDVAKLPTCGVKSEALRLPVEGRGESWIWNCVLLCVCVLLLLQSRVWGLIHPHGRYLPCPSKSISKLWHAVSLLLSHRPSVMRVYYLHEQMERLFPMRDWGKSNDRSRKVMGGQRRADRRAELGRGHIQVRVLSLKISDVFERGQADCINLVPNQTWNTCPPYHVGGGDGGWEQCGQIERMFETKKRKGVRHEHVFGIISKIPGQIEKNQVEQGVV